MRTILAITLLYPPWRRQLQVASRYTALLCAKAPTRITHVPFRVVEAKRQDNTLTTTTTASFFRCVAEISVRIRKLYSNIETHV